MVGRNPWAIGRIGGIDVRIDPSWTFIAFLVAYSFFLTIDLRFNTAGTATKIAVSAGMAIIFFASILLHELTHSWVGVSRGVEVESITLFLFGGATRADLDTEEPGDELAIATVGPLSSFALAGVFWAIALAFGPGTIGGFVAGQLGWINLVLGAFNLVPGFPLDGGRVLRSLVWRRTGDLVRATRIAARGGQLVGYGLIGLGAFDILLLGDLVGGLWMIAIGWFLSQAAQASFLQLQIRRVLAEVPASKIMSNGIVEIPGDISIQQAVDLRRVVVMDDGHVAGIITPRDLSRWLQRSQDLGLYETAGRTLRSAASSVDTGPTSWSQATE